MSGFAALLVAIHNHGQAQIVHMSDLRTLFEKLCQFIHASFGVIERFERVSNSGTVTLTIHN